LTDAAKVIAESPSALQLRYLQTLTEIGVERNTVIVFPVPLDLLSQLVTLPPAKSSAPATPAKS